MLLPSFAVYRHWIPQSVLSQARSGFERTDLLGIFICVVIVGSLLSTSRRVLVAGMLRIWLPLLVASVAALVTGTLAGLAVGAPARQVLLRILIPAMAGGLTAGVLPLAVAYAGIFGSDRGQELALILPAMVLANLLAVLVAGVISARAGRLDSTQLETGEPAAALVPAAALDRGGWVGEVLGAIGLLSAIYLCGTTAHRLLGYPTPLVLVAVAATVRLLCPLPQWLTRGTAALYRGFVRVFTYPLLFAVGLLLMPWQGLVDGLSLACLTALGCAVATLAVVGGFTARWVHLPPADGVLIALTRVAMGGSGDLAILNAAGRLDLMPFAQLATRAGGAVTLAATLLVVAF